jgi:hypothetical protein
MPLFNTEGLVLFGPGSEWFWSMLQFVIVAVTLLGIYSQLRLARSANSFEQANRLREDLESERTTRNALAICLALKAGDKPEDLPEGAVSYIQDYWENVAGLVRAGHLEQELLEHAFGNRCRWWWAALEPNIQRFQEETGNPKSGEHFEWLAAIMAEADRRAGSVYVVDAAYVAKSLDRSIERFRDHIRVAEDLRAAPIRPSA